MRTQLLYEVADQATMLYIYMTKRIRRGLFQVELSSGEEVADVLPNLEQLKKCAGRGVIVTGQAPPGSGYDFFSRFFAPKKGVDEVIL